MCIACNGNHAYMGNVCCECMCQWIFICVWFAYHSITISVYRRILRQYRINCNYILNIIMFRQLQSFLGYIFRILRLSRSLCLLLSYAHVRSVSCTVCCHSITLTKLARILHPHYSEYSRRLYFTINQPQ